MRRKRFLAIAIDFLAILFINNIVGLMMGDFYLNNSQQVNLTVSILYYVVLQVLLDGRTLGKLALKLRVTADAGEFDFRRGILRYTSLFFQLYAIIMLAIFNTNLYKLQNDLTAAANATELDLNAYLDLLLQFSVAFMPLNIYYFVDGVVFLSTRNKSLHDLIARTTVVEE